MNASVVAVAGAKGGVGKTTTAINLGATIAREGKRAVVVELDLAMANAVDFLDFGDEPRPTVHDVLAGEASPLAAVHRIGEGFAVAPSGTDLEGFAAVDLDNLDGFVEVLRGSFDVVVLDTGAGVSRETIAPLELADATVLISTPRVAAVRDAKKTKALAERVGGELAGLVLTKSGTGASPGADRISEFLGVPLLGHVPDDDAVPSSQDHGEPVVERHPNSGAAHAYGLVATKLLGTVSPGRSTGKATTEFADDRFENASSGTPGDPSSDDDHRSLEGGSPKGAVSRSDGGTTTARASEPDRSGDDGESATQRDDPADDWAHVDQLFDDDDVRRATESRPSSSVDSTATGSSGRDADDRDVAESDVPDRDESEDETRNAGASERSVGSERVTDETSGSDPNPNAEPATDPDPSPNADPATDPDPDGTGGSPSGDPESTDVESSAQSSADSESTDPERPEPERSSADDADPADDDGSVLGRVRSLLGR